jgi:hypothetical protein
VLLCYFDLGHRIFITSSTFPSSIYGETEITEVKANEEKAHWHGAPRQLEEAIAYFWSFATDVPISLIIHI